MVLVPAVVSPTGTVTKLNRRILPECACLGVLPLAALALSDCSTPRPSCRRAPSFVKLVGPSGGRGGRPAQEVMLVGPGAC